MPANDPSPDRGADAHSPAADADAARRAAFLDPPVYAELSMPDLSGPREPLPTSFGPPPPQVPSGQFADLVAGAAGTVAAGSVAAGSVAAGSVAARGEPHRRNGRLRPSSGRWRLMVAGAGVAAIAVAAIIGWSVYDDRTPIPLALQTPSSPATAGNTSPAMTGHLKSDHSTRPAGLTSPSAGHPSPTSSPQGHARPTSTPKGTPSGRPGPHRSASPNPSPSTAPSRSISPSASPSPSPSPTPSSSSTTQPSQPALPPGWVWHTFTASQLGAIAGFEIGLPPAWTQNVTGQVAHLNLPVSKFHVTVGLAPWAYPVPLSQADYLDDIDSATYPRFRTLLLRGIGFAAAGGYEPAKAAELKFSWVKPAAGKLIRYVLLVTLDTSSGAQPYTLAVSAPAATFGPASGVFHTALGTFRPLPASP